MRKRVLVTMPSMFIGGAERSLIGLLEALDASRFETDLFLYRHEGEFLGLIPGHVRLLPRDSRYAALDTPIRTLLRTGRWRLGVLRILAKLALAARSRLAGRPASAFHDMYYIGKVLLPFLPRIDGTYDLAINFLGSNDILLRRVEARVRMGWVHTDYSRYHQPGRHDSAMWERWGRVDYIVNVSEEASRIFQECLPFLAPKCIAIENILSPDTVRRQAGEFEVSDEMPPVPGELRICSVGRFCTAKNFDAIPDIVRRLQEEGCRVRWYLIGHGPDEALVRHRIREAGVEGRVLLLGGKANPYPYMKACDLYVQPSRFEGKAVTVREAQILGKPVLITRFPSAGSQLEDGVDGLITPMDVEGVVAGIRRLATDPVLREGLAAAAARRDYSNRAEVEKLMALAGGRP